MLKRITVYLPDTYLYMCISQDNTSLSIEEFRKLVHNYFHRHYRTCIRRKVSVLIFCGGKNHS